MKKKIIYALITFLSLCLAGCGGKFDDLLIQSEQDDSIVEENVKTEATHEAADANIDFILSGTISESENDDWKQAYAPIVKQWDIIHGNEYSCGYELVYIDDDDVPELILACDDEAWTGYDIYTCIDGKAVQLRYEDDDINNPVSEIVSPGCHGKGDTYIEKTGIYMRTLGTMGCTDLDGYVLEGNVLKKAFNYFYYDISWDETAANPYGYIIEYTDNNGEEIKKEVVADGDGDYYDIANAPESEEIEKLYNCDFKKIKFFNCSMDYKTICYMLGVADDSIELSCKDKYAKLLYQYMRDCTKGICEGFDGFSYQTDGGKFILKDINNDGVEEMLLTVIGMEYNVFVPGDTWEDSYVGNITAYSDDGIIERAYGETFTYFYAYYRLEGSELMSFESFCRYDNEETCELEYVHADRNGNENVITEAEFYAGGDLYGVHDVEGEWYDITEENINRILLR